MRVPNMVSCCFYITDLPYCSNCACYHSCSTHVEKSLVEMRSNLPKGLQFTLSPEKVECPNFILSFNFPVCVMECQKIGDENHTQSKLTKLTSHKVLIIQKADNGNIEAILNNRSYTEKMKQLLVVDIFKKVSLGVFINSKRVSPVFSNKYRNLRGNLWLVIVQAIPELNFEQKMNRFDQRYPF